MKKLMIAAAIVCAAAFANAATCTWGCDYAWGQKGDTETYSDGSSVGNYWIVALGDTTIGNYAVSTDGELVYKGTDGKYAKVGSTLQSGAYDAYGLGSTIDGLKQADNDTVLALIIHDTTVGAWGISGAESITGITDVPPANAQAITFTNWYDSEYGQKDMLANQALVNVPEPTSGLLLLLGVAGLALRRRRA